mmetsp:Transcript_10772/g.25074  ORF Transcript_10772/g.25074 Transcript_10772/m.25074 type:complete len:418 (-) Transcript_10772:1661-2914(-)
MVDESFSCRRTAGRTQNTPISAKWDSVIGPRCIDQRDEDVLTPGQMSSDSSVDSSSSIPEVISLSWSSMTAASSTVLDDDEFGLSSSLSSSTQSFARLHTTQKPAKGFTSPTTTAISPRSTRNIFGAYWDSPSNQTSTLSQEDDELLRRFKLPPSRYPFKLPLGNLSGADESDQHRCPVVDHKPQHESDGGDESDSRPTRRLSIDDSDVTYTAPANQSLRRRRRQILPKPPAYTAMSSSLAMPRHSVPEHEVSDSSAPQRLWNSTSALLKPKGCLRPSRYSSSSELLGQSVSASIPASTDSRALLRSASVDCSGIVPTLSGRRRLHLSQRNNGCYDLAATATASSESKCQSPPKHVRQDATKDPELGARHRSASCDLPRPLREGMAKSVSFYSQVDVYEFHLPTERTSDEGWLKYFF